MSDSLGNEAILKKIDRLRETNIGTFIPLPQLVVVGDQSSGKSSVLESLTGFSFPRAATLCTRYATQITCVRDAVKRVTVSIIPRSDANATLKSHLLKFRRSLNHFNNDDLAQIFEEANSAMGIGSDQEGLASAAFSEDILKIEISGPDQIHLTVIDVPGIFRVATPGVTRESDVELVRNIVKRYMADKRTIILTVLPCNVDVATQEILKLAEEADPEGVRTMGVLTKPDLASEKATQDALIDLVMGRRNKLRLGYYVLKNRSADDSTSSTDDRMASERAFFSQPPWSLSAVAEYCGVARLKKRLRSLLMELSRKELPRVQAEVRQRMQKCREDLQTLGPSRADESSQRQYLVQIVNRMERITRSSLNGYYMDDPLFRDRPKFKLITRILELSEDFAEDFWANGHYQEFRAADPDKKTEKKEEAVVVAAEAAKTEDGDSFVDLASVLDELDDIIDTSYECPAPLEGPMTPNIRRIYQSSRGPELGTYNGAVLAAAFVDVSQKWRELALAHTSRVIVLVHEYMHNLLGVVCVDEAVQEQIWGGILREELLALYEQAMDQTKMLIEMECECPPMTLNRRFNEILQSRRQARLAKQMEGLAVSRENERKFVALDEVERQVLAQDNGEHACEAVLYALEGYYAIARERLIDTLHQQVVYRLLQGRQQSLLTVLSADRVMALTSEQLEAIAGEDSASRSIRASLQRQMESLQEAAKILR